MYINMYVYIARAPGASLLNALELRAGAVLEELDCAGVSQLLWALPTLGRCVWGRVGVGVGL